MNSFIVNIALIHLVSSIMALIFGTWIFLELKGTKIHRQVGYSYLGCMVLLLISAFMLYEVDGSFGIFHIAAVLSAITLLLGMIPVVRQTPNGIIRHFSWMYWSVIGLYGAFVSEIATRLIPEFFYESVGVAMVVVMLIGALIFSKAIPIWKKQFNSKSSKTNRKDFNPARIS